MNNLLALTDMDLSTIILFLNSICSTFSIPVEDYIDFDLINNNKSYSYEFQRVLFPCPKLFEFVSTHMM